ncbi:MAG: hypothetical protein ABIJ46_00410 [bacterium]
MRSFLLMATLHLIGCVDDGDLDRLALEDEVGLDQLALSGEPPLRTISVSVCDDYAGIRYLAYGPIIGVEDFVGVCCLQYGGEWRLVAASRNLSLEGGGDVFIEGTDGEDHFYWYSGGVECGSGYSTYRVGGAAPSDWIGRLWLYGRDGDDYLSSLDHDNEVHGPGVGFWPSQDGGPGSDIFDGQCGPDSIVGGEGPDFMYDRCSDGRDVFNGGPGDDTIINWDDGATWVQPGAGSDFVETGDGPDVVSLTPGDPGDVNEIYTYGGNDTVDGSDQTDWIWTGPGRDICRGHGGWDLCDGGPDKDLCDAESEIDCEG